MVGDLGLGFLLNLWKFVFGIVDDETAATPREFAKARASELGHSEEVGHFTILPLLRSSTRLSFLRCLLYIYHL